MFKKYFPLNVQENSYTVLKYLILILIHLKRQEAQMLQNGYKDSFKRKEQST